MQFIKIVQKHFPLNIYQFSIQILQIKKARLYDYEW